MADIVKKPFQRHQPLPKPEPNAETKAGLVRPAQYPGVIPVESVSPKRRLADIQRYVMHSNRQLGSLPISDGMDCLERRTQFSLIDPLFRSPSLEPCLRFGHTSFDGFHAVAAGERAPRPHPVGLQDDIRIDEHGTRVSRHDVSQLDWALDLMPYEQIRKVLDGPIE